MVFNVVFKWQYCNDFISACDLYSLTCGVLYGDLTVKSSCYDTKSYSELNDIYVYVSADTRFG